MHELIHRKTGHECYESMREISASILPIFMNNINTEYNYQLHATQQYY